MNNTRCSERSEHCQPYVRRNQRRFTTKSPHSATWHPFIATMSLFHRLFGLKWNIPSFSILSWVSRWCDYLVVGNARCLRWCKWMHARRSAMKRRRCARTSRKASGCCSLRLPAQRNSSDARRHGSKNTWGGKRGWCMKIFSFILVASRKQTTDHINCLSPGTRNIAAKRSRISKIEIDHDGLIPRGH